MTCKCATLRKQLDACVTTTGEPNRTRAIYICCACVNGVRQRQTDAAKLFSSRLCADENAALQDDKALMECPCSNLYVA